MCKQFISSSLLGMVMAFWATSIFGQGPDTLWTRTFGGSTYMDEGFSVQQTTDGGYIIAGRTSYNNDDVYLVKTDVNGNRTWSKSIGDPNYQDEGYSVQQTTDGGYIITGYTEYQLGNAFVVKTDANGNPSWSKKFGRPDEPECGYSVQQTSDGGYIIAGFAQRGTYEDIYLIKTDGNGDDLWRETYDVLDDDWGYAVQQTSDEGYIIAGCAFDAAVNWDVILLKTDKNGNHIWTRTFGGSNDDVGYSVQQTTDGGYIIAGYTESYGAGGADVYLIKTDAGGNHLWAKTYGGGTYNDYGHSVQQTTDGGYIIAGWTSYHNTDVYVIKTDANGTTMWTKTYGGTAGERGYSVEQTSDGGYVIAGYTCSFGAGGCDVYLIRLASETGIEEKGPFHDFFFISRMGPNPFKDRTSIEYGLPKSDNVHITVYNLLGQEIKTLVSKKESLGIHTVMWDGRDGSGNEVTSGPYFLTIQVGKYADTRKMILLR